MIRIKIIAALSLPLLAVLCAHPALGKMKDNHALVF